MIDIKKALGVYLITDEGKLQGRDFYAVVEKALQGGVTMVQLREKKGTSREFYEKAKRLRILTMQYQVPLIINDRVDIALAVSADGVHIGQKDIPAQEVRKITGNSMIIGVTANTIELARQAEADGADYLGTGAVFSTSTKQDAKPLTIERLKEITTSVHIPIVAIGGITIENAKALEGSGVAGMAVSSGIMGEKNPDEAAEKLKKIINKFY